MSKKTQALIEWSIYRQSPPRPSVGQTKIADPAFDDLFDGLEVDYDEDDFDIDDEDEDEAPVRGPIPIMRVFKPEPMFNPLEGGLIANCNFIISNHIFRILSDTIGVEVIKPLSPYRFYVKFAHFWDKNQEVSKKNLLRNIQKYFDTIDSL